MVGREDMANAVALNSAQFNTSRILGPAVAGLLIGAFDISFAFLINAISYLAVIVAYLAMRESELRSVEQIARPTTIRAVFDNLAEGGRYIRNTPLVLLAIVVLGLVATFGMNFQVLIPPLADNVLKVGASGYGFLMAASGLGSTIVALSVAFSRKVRPQAIVLGGIALGLGSILLAASSSFGIALIAMFIVGAGGIGMAVTANTTMQMAVPDQLRGRVMSVYTTVFAGSVPVGGLLMGAIASAWGVPFALLIGGILSLAVGLGGWAWLRRIRGVERPRVVDERVAAAASGETSLGAARRR
jgi:predicted MFS family arabinose efflux permease